MNQSKITAHFIKHICITDVFVILALIIYNIFSLFVPINRIRIGTSIVFLLIIDACLVGIKLVNNFNFGSHRQI